MTERKKELTYDGFKMYDMITGYGVAAAADEAWKLKGGKEGASVVIQGFGCVGASCVNSLYNMGYKVVGIADVNGLVYCKDGLNIPKLVETRLPKGELNREAFEDNYEVLPNTEWISADCDILIPAALEDVINKDNADKIKASLLVEAANIPTTPEADEILQKKGVDVAVDFISNLGGIRIYEAVIFRIVKIENMNDEEAAKAIVDDTVNLIRKQTKLYLKKQQKPENLQETLQEDYLHRINLTHRICKKKLTEIQRERSWGLSERQPPFSVYGMRNILN